VNTAPRADALHDGASTRIAASKLRLEAVCKRFDVSGAQSTVAVADFTLDIARGEFLVIVGPSGCGKTTVLNVLAGLDAPTSGAVTIDGRAIRGPGPDRGVMFQDYALFPWHTVWGNVEFGLRHGPAGAALDADARRKRVEGYVDLVGLSGSEATTLAPTTAAPDGSVTWPLILARNSCAKPDPATARKQTLTVTNLMPPFLH